MIAPVETKQHENMPTAHALRFPLGIDCWLLNLQDEIIQLSLVTI